jgi:phage N-6-adenine-methyltransferase
MLNKSLFSSKTDDWATPQDFFDKLDAEFHFDLDVCASKQNAKCKLFYSEGGLEKEWPVNMVKWMNPPYGREIGKWVNKASENPLTVCLLPARTDTKWFWNYIAENVNAEVRFIKGRLKFGDSKNSAPFPSMIVLFK